MSDLLHRRTFMRAALAAGAAWATTDLLQVESALAWAVQANGADFAALKALTPAQARVVDAVASRILPSVDGRPGAHEAGVVYFVERSLSTFNASQKTFYAQGIADLNQRAAAKSGSGRTFDALPATDQDDVLRAIEKTPFFQAFRFDTIVGTFGLPTWGGNKEYAGWHMIGFDHQPRFQPPFGYYDAESAGRD
ncbi:MAG: gluconate 2-dehydrogenase subunit 3 family protein [Vicinamibacterales bacterium]